MTSETPAPIPAPPVEVEQPTQVAPGPEAAPAKKASPKKGGKAVGTRLEELEDKVTELTWYTAELLAFIQNAIADTVAAQEAPNVQARVQQELQELQQNARAKVRTVGLGGMAGLSGFSAP